MSSSIDDVICTCLTRVYADHSARTDRLTCRLEHALPIRHTFFRLKRVPHFQTRDDLHSEHTPAYLPIYRLENASLESLSQKSKAGCRRVLIEGDLGTGKTLVCQRLLHEWAKAMQFFRHVKIDQPYILVDTDQTGSYPGHNKHQHQAKAEVSETNGQGDAEGTEDESDTVRRHRRHPWNLNAFGEQHSSRPEVQPPVEIRVTVSKSKSCNSHLNSFSGSYKGADVNVTCRKTDSPDNNRAGGDNGDHRSRRALFVEQKEQEQMMRSNSGHNRARSGSEDKAGRGSRSRSNGESSTRKREKAICDGIPQKYLSLLNIGSPGEGAFESPNRIKGPFREPRRQRPSRLTSNLTDYKAIIYVPCVRMSLAEILNKCNNSRVRHYYVAATVLQDLLFLSDVPHHPLSFDAVYQWVLTNREDICIIFDNIDGSEAWQRLISDAFHDKDGFGKMIAAATPGRISKRDVDTLFYCYGLATEYSNKTLLSRLRTEAPSVVDRISFLLTSNHTQELLCNPLSLSLLAAYFRSVYDDDDIPEHLSELLENLIQHAMAHENNSVQNVSKGRRQRFSLQGVCETVAFECLENDTNYFSKQKFPKQFWVRHLCDCRVLHEVHEIANFASIHERLPSPVANPVITPDSDSVHSSTSSNFDVNINPETSPSNQILNVLSDQDNEPTIKLDTTTTGVRLQVPQIHNSLESSKRYAERPKCLSLDMRTPPGKQVQTTQASGEIVSFTSRCIRDFLASKRVCRYLMSDRDCEGFIQRLISKPQFYPVLRLTVRSLYIMDRSDIILNLLDMLLTSQEIGYVPYGIQSSPSPRGLSPTNFQEPRARIPHRYRVSNSDCPFRAKKEDLQQRRSSTSILGTCLEGATLKTSISFNRLLGSTSLSPYTAVTTPDTSRGYLEDFKEALIWLAETDNSEPYIGAVSNRFPDTLVISYQDCPSETIDHFICLTMRSSPVVSEVVLYMSGFYSQWDLGLRLAEALRELKNLTTLRVSMKCVVETSFLVDFICECFEGNEHIETLYLEGPMNVAENLTPCEHKRVQKTFSEQRGLKTLVLDHFSYHHRISYLLASWPNVLRALQIKRSNIDSVAEKINEKLTGSPEMTSLTLENCFVPSHCLHSIVSYINAHASSVNITTLEFTLLSSARKFNKNDAKKTYFKPAITNEVCASLAELVHSSPSLKHLILSYNGLSDEKAKVLLQATVGSRALATLDLTGNLIGNAVEDDVMLLLNKATNLKSLLLGDNNITKETRSVIIRGSLSRHDLRLSL
ncbi:hypothetical protein Bpfe_027862 [Biomphalaria pfeifferi]|uniref:NACHT domain-containing protein n=1 Tax=Biomphalaria pfeifferi TaxID=112525 RepID=A0AAD8AVQ9_BIOPF|nr:hypothetical protein Bpfe_027862 [Biomphalaria pfeifferi]